MNLTVLILTVILIYFNADFCRSQLFLTNNLPHWASNEEGLRGMEEDELILTPIIESGDVMKGRQLSRVDKKFFLNVTSYSGYLTVNEQYESNLWFWFFPAQGTEHLYETDWNDYDDYEQNEEQKNVNWENENAPLVLWLQGGPGSSSLFGLFTENGPFLIDEESELEIKSNPYSWHTKYSMLYIDNPVGTGFSYTDFQGLTKNVTEVGEHLYIGLVQFLKLFPWLQSVPFYVTGESYAGKYIPSIGYQIYKNNENSYFKINLQGLALRNALSDPINMLDYADFAYQHGLIDDDGKREMQIFEILARQNIFKKESKIYWDLILYTFITKSRYDNVYNILQPTVLNLETYLKFVEQPKIRKALHVGKLPFNPPLYVYMHLSNDFLNSAMPWTEYLLEQGCRIMYYSGNLDFIVAYPLSENSFKKMKWSKSNTFLNATRTPFYVNSKLSGYIKKTENFAEVVILNAGHMVPTDQPKAALELLDLFINNKL